MSENAYRDLELYIHIPFCVRKCLYCDFLSQPADRETQDSYMEALLQEVGGRSEECLDYRVVSVFVGGGTPSVVDPVWIERLMETIRAGYRLCENAEITMELNPGTATKEALIMYKAAGINRLSIGLQATEDELLKKIGRIHDWNTFCNTYRLAREAGFSNINVDMMSGLPGQDRESYVRGLTKVCTLPDPPEHISAYGLIVEENTPLCKMVEEGTISLPDEDAERDMYADTEQILKQYGYERYEISNYAREGFRCRHNIGYWTQVSYLGLGIGAASFMDQIRFGNKENLQEYVKHPLECRAVESVVDRKGQMEEFCFLGLRLTEGISENRFFSRFGQKLDVVYGKVIRQNCLDGLLEWVKKTEEDDRRLRLTARGLDLANYVMAQFLL